MQNAEKTRLPRNGRDEIRDRRKPTCDPFWMSSPNCFSCFVGDLGAGENVASFSVLSKSERFRNILEAVSLQADVKLPSSPVF